MWQADKGMTPPDKRIRRGIYKYANMFREFMLMTMYRYKFQSLAATYI